MTRLYSRLVAFFIALLPGAAIAETKQSAQAGPVSITADSDAVKVTLASQPVLEYRRTKPANSPSRSTSPCYFHPLTTPSGFVMTDVGPNDHPYHRGVELAWLEVHGPTSANDYWAEPYTPNTIMGRVVNVGADNVAATNHSASFAVQNQWLEKELPIIEEKLRVAVTFRDDARIYDLAYQLSPKTKTTLGQRAYSGFSVRMRKDSPATAFGAAGKIALPKPYYLKPESGWAAQTWVAFELALPDNKKAGLAVINHSKNPPTLWHCVTDIALLNPCIVAPGAVTFTAEKPLALDYRVVTFDGAVPTALLNELADEFGSTKSEAPGHPPEGQRK